MAICINCGLDAVDPADPPRYDVLADGAGPYCLDCFEDTPTGAVILGALTHNGKE